ncbi:hypothetical protein PMIN03_006525 [Paraphaeosphaeria minitans]
MLESPYLLSFSSTSPPYPSPVSLFEKFKAILTPFRNAAIGYVEGLQLAADRVVSGITSREVTNLQLDDLYRKTENDTSFHAISYKSKRPCDEEAWSPELEEDLRLPVYFNSNCSKVVYCLLPQVRKTLKDDPDFDRAFWSREYVDPELVLFDVDKNGNQCRRPLPFLAHDFITIKSKDNQRFVLDVTGDQLGLKEWFFTRSDYRGLLLDGQAPEISSEATKLYEIETEDSRNFALLSAVEQAIEEVKADWGREYISCQDLHFLPPWKQSELRQGITVKVRMSVVAALSG